jgi:hypothetical protein
MAVCAYSAEVDMTQDEIIEIATQVYGECVWHESALQRLEAFVKLVAAKEREACAKEADEYATYGGLNFYDSFKKLAAIIRARGEA